MPFPPQFGGGSRVRVGDGLGQPGFVVVAIRTFGAIRGKPLLRPTTEPQQVRITPYRVKPKTPANDGQAKTLAHPTLLKAHRP